MNGKISIWGIAIPTGILAVITFLTGIVFKQLNDKIDVEVKDRKAENKDQYSKINKMQNQVTGIERDVKWMCKSMGKPEGE